MKEKISFEEFKEFFSDILGLEPETINQDTNLISDLGVDSLSLVNVMFRLEKEFNIKFSDDDRIMTQSLGKAYDLLIFYQERNQN